VYGRHVRINAGVSPIKKSLAMKLMEPEVALSLKNILLAVDFSPASEPAVRYARAIARQYLSDVHTIHVNGPDSYHLLSPEAFRVAIRDRQIPADVGHLINHLLEGLPNEVPLRHEGIWGVIADVIARNQIDLLVLGTHGRTGLAKFVAGSISEQVLRNVYCPVLTIGPKVPPAGEKLNFQNVLLATDLDPCSAAPLYAGWLCSQFGGSLTTLHITSEFNGKSANDRDQVSQVKAMLAANHFFKPSRIFIQSGTPSAKILETISILRPNMIVLGARHPARPAISEHLPWSTVSKVIAGAKCPVLTVRELM